MKTKKNHYVLDCILHSCVLIFKCQLLFIWFINASINLFFSTNNRVTELLQKWFLVHSSKLKKDMDMKRVVVDFSKTAKFLSADETFFYITTLCNSYKNIHVNFFPLFVY